MKQLLLILAFLPFAQIPLQAQTGIIILTERIQGTQPFRDTVYVIGTNGSITPTPIASPVTDAIQHDADLNVIINNIVNQGYQQMEFYPLVDTVFAPFRTYVRRIFFGVP